MKRHEMLRQQYHNKRYMEHLSETDLRQRAHDILLNILVLKEEAKISLVPLSKGGAYWGTLFTHLLEEFELRFGPYPAGFPKELLKDVRILYPNSFSPSKAAEVVSKFNLKHGTYLAKFGKYCHMRDALEQGAIHISPASSYDDPSLNSAIKDTELRLSLQVHPSDVQLVINDRAALQPKQVKPIGNVTFTQESKTDYYIYCLSSCLAPRLFLDFDYDACLIISRPQHFISRLLTEFAQILPNWHGAGVPVNYFDPLNTNRRDIHLFSCKHFRYAYQKEYRVVWLPPSTIQKLDPVDLKLGNLEAYCELLSLNE